jgi:hypothetical protein
MWTTGRWEAMTGFNTTVPGPASTGIMSLECITGMTGLQNLYLANKPITDKGLEHLKGMTGLKFLNLDGTQVTDAGVQHLKQNLSGLNIYRSQTN